MSDVSTCDDEDAGSRAQTVVVNRTRQSSTIFGLGSRITQDDEHITGSRLPTSLQVLRCLRYHLEEGRSERRSRWEAAKLVYTKVAIFYDKANIPMITERKACEKMIKLLDHNANIRAIPMKRRSMPAAVRQIEQMEVTLAETFCLWPANAEQLIKNPEDLQFLKSMMGNRCATFGPHDKVLASKVKRRQQRDQAEEARRQKMCTSELTSTTTAVMLSDSDTSCLESSGDSEFEISSASVSSLTANLRSHKRTARTGTPAFIPHDIIKRPKLVALATRLKMTPAQQATYTEALIAEAGGNLSKVSSSYATADKSRRKVGEKLAQVGRERWVVPKFVTLHWDSKLMSSLSNPNVIEERLTVIVGSALDLKLLGVPAYRPGTIQVRRYNC